MGSIPQYGSTNIPNGGDGLTVAKPHVDLEGLLVRGLDEVNSHVPEGALKGAQGSLDSHLSGLNSHLN